MQNTPNGSHGTENTSTPVRSDTVLGALELRDWFAGQALAGLFANSSLEWPEGKDAVVVAAKEAYWAADAMIEARKEAK